MSGNAVLMVLIGGVGTLTGPIAGALIVAGMEQYTAQFGSWVTVVQGVIFIICVLVFRRGLVGEIAGYYQRAMMVMADRTGTIGKDQPLQQR